MSKTWAYADFVVEEGMKPEDGNSRDDDYQYFLIAKRGGARVFKYCIWLEKVAILANPDYSAERELTGHKIPESMYQQAVASVKAKIDADDFHDRLLRVSADGALEVDLENVDTKAE